jgi:ABC-type protease/lipase transport system fused ATPase/permease subunit
MHLSRQSNAGLNLRFAVWSAAVFSGVANLLALTGPIFMLEIYDRVIPSRSIPTLIALFALAAGLYAFSGFFDVLRFRVMARVASGVDASLSAAYSRLSPGRHSRGRSTEMRYARRAI